MKTPEALAKTVSPETITARRLEAGLPIVFAVLLGFFMLVGAGFAQTTHDTAHDTRHSLGFPCH